MMLSETLFEKFCSNSGIECNRIQTGNSKTPDYNLIIDGQQIIVEVKEINRNKEEQESDRLLDERGYGNVLSNTPGDRVRAKIKKASHQIKALAKERCPSILVLFDRGYLFGHLTPYDIRVAMYGLERIHINVPRYPSISPYATGMSYGPERRMTDEYNTSISAIGVLYCPGVDNILLLVYHNKYSVLKIDPKLLSKRGIKQFELGDGVPGNTAKWKELVVS